MSKIVFRLKDVPEEEADAIRALLTDKDIEFFETDAGRWGISIGAIWVKDDDDFGVARELIEAFQREHRERVQQQYEQDKKAGKVASFWQLLSQSPLQVLAYLLLIVIVLAFTLLPMLQFFK
ncbi:DUF6164 family protein [Reinekea marinisedimentorum]|uniref:Signal transducing protein n=1 Tax=Reinekea marinisedimentorum TaxID=230495 RepID=A0A4R3I170_9GAMM|nr:DUF6164 family protein [Reinekea marinisedimentorum]TCS38743.1 hypothetical protein BCF53_11517 [Reinekea marinisedimentorum]